MRRVLPLVSTVALFAVAMVVTPVVVRPALTMPRRERRYAGHEANSGSTQ
jgi:hypothetical protein